VVVSISAVCNLAFRIFIGGDTILSYFARCILVFGYTLQIPFYISITDKYDRWQQFVLRFVSSPFVYLHTILVVLTVGGGLLLIVKSIGGNCQEGQRGWFASCNYLDGTGYLPPGNVSLPVAVIIFAQIIGRAYDMRVLTFCWTFLLVSVFASMFIIQSPRSATDTCTVFMFTACSLAYSKQTKLSYEIQIQQQAAQRELTRQTHEKELMDMRSTEVRFLVGNMAHDLKTPIQSFMTEVSTLSDAMAALQEQVRNLPENSVRTQAESSVIDCLASLENLRITDSFMMMTINRCLDYTKTTSGVNLVPNKQTVDILHCLSWAVKCVTSGQNRVPVVICPLPTSICSHIITDYQWLTENVLCLLSNALKFTIDGSVMIKCEKVVNEFGAEVDMLLFQIIDSGIGISKEKQAELFQPFQQAQNMAGGTGLGLYSMSKRVNAIGGTCGVRDRADRQQGTCFWFTLPYVPDEESATAAGASVQNRSLSAIEVVRQQHAGTVGPHEANASQNSDNRADCGGDGDVEKGPCVLVVDDAIVVQKTISRQLQGSGFRVDLCDNGLSGLRMMTGSRYDLVLMDLYMPVLDGAEAVKRIRQHEADTFVPANEKHRIVGISANVDDATRQACLECGMNDVMSKPFNLASLKAVCRQQSWDVFQRLHMSRSAHVILVVEDAVVVSKTMERALRKQGVRVDLAENGMLATQKMKKCLYSLVLMDVNMPIMDGPEATRVQRRHEMEIEAPTQARQRIVGTSGDASEEATRVCGQSGMDAVLPKPFQMQELKQLCADKAWTDVFPSPATAPSVLGTRTTSLVEESQDLYVNAAESGISAIRSEESEVAAASFNSLHAPP
jgi:CheY-like chemotaxis protein/signal transduction histidine kinase